MALWKDTTHSPARRRRKTSLTRVPRRTLVSRRRPTSPHSVPMRLARPVKEVQRLDMKESSLPRI